MTIRFTNPARVEITNPRTLEIVTINVVQDDVLSFADNVELTIIPVEDETIQNEEKSE